MYHINTLYTLPLHSVCRCAQPLNHAQLCDPMDCSLPGSSAHGILQVRILGWVSIPLCRGSSRPRDWSWVSCIAGRFFTVWATREAPALHSAVSILFQFKKKKREKEKKNRYSSRCQGQVGKLNHKRGKDFDIHLPPGWFQSWQHFP